MLLTTLALSACGTPAAKDFGGRWRPINQLPTSTTAIPLNPPYVFFAAPTDITLRTMLARWAKDNSLDLSYELGNDYTLVQPVTQVRTADLRSAVEQLNAIYASSLLLVSITHHQILVQPVSASAPATTPDASTSQR
ncbi:hypothetical protein [Dyella nitratireducens]|uniref:Toxin co-regulated pilus biosynthesis protein Q C-terminal domain-containing protein n=1 Tax=Dyella nitratireducens TaxID=1849580 RepID=A0ABQ1FM05_9GAMM|nr:hypothetical protein [Dyella nitratireducens]GGA22072.1 hypothetical protein GCM10010981_07810 [Dyella nitratireducens]GLQ44159.1 hypothetical protein GCM10007902_40090 [Dyella nitratireducens]